jgi:hypothetical protein
MTNLSVEDLKRIEAIESYLIKLSKQSPMPEYHFTPYQPIDTTEGEPFHCETETTCEYQCSVCKQETEFLAQEQGKEWKVGEWVKDEQGDIGVIKRGLRDSKYIEIDNQDGDVYEQYEWCLTKPSPEEIQAHLVAIAQKYIGKKVYELHKGVKRTIIDGGGTNNGDWFYDEKADTLYALSPESEWDLDEPNECSNPPIYRKGKWAEIIPEIIAPIETEQRWGVNVRPMRHNFNDHEITIYLDNGVLSIAEAKKAAEAIKQYLSTNKF